MGSHIEGITCEERDDAMTRDFDYDILRYVSIEEQRQLYGDTNYSRVSATRLQMECRRSH